jgi:hypothetical protein
VLGILIPVVLYIAYQGTQYQGLSWQPNELVEASNKADTFIRQNNISPADEGVNVFTYDSYAEWIRMKIKPDLYQTETVWLPSIFPPKIKRTGVNVFTVKNLKASSGLGSVAVKANPGGTIDFAGGGVGAGNGRGGAGNAENSKGERWAVITGLIPIKQQLDAYINAFSGSVLPDSARDMPAYFLYKIERAEVVDGKQGKWVDIDPVKQWVEKQTQWQSFGVDPVDPTFLAPAMGFPMAYPLPPVTKKFTENVVHEPEIPMLSDTQAEMLRQAEVEQKKMMDDLMKFDADALRKGNPFANERDNVNNPRKNNNDPNVKPVVVTDYLFRFLDFSVLPGKTYQYRVQLELLNPNYELQAQFLEKEELAKEKYLITAFSSPSNSITIPLESRVLATNTTPASVRNPWDEPFAKITAVYFDLQDGSEWYVEKDRVYRGTVCNFAKQEVVNAQLEPQSDLGSSTMPTQPTASTSGNKPKTSAEKEAEKKRLEQEKELEKKYKQQKDIVSDVVILDISGGNTLYNAPSDVLDIKTPGRMMILEPSGEIVIHRMNADLSEIEQMKNPQGRTLGGIGGGNSRPMPPRGKPN